MSYHCFSFTVTDKVAHLVFNRPAAMNTMQPIFLRELGEILATLQRTASARALVISSTGKHFTAGMALDVFSAGEKSDITISDKNAVHRANIVLILEDIQRTFTQIE